MQEVFKDINGYEGLYQISNLGKVKSFNHGSPKILKSGKSTSGYSQVYLCKNKTKRQCQIHRLVAMAFIDNPDNKKDVNHINGIKTDNIVANLEWNTRAENIKHAYLIGLNKIGENHGNAKLKESQVLSILNDNRSHSKIALDYHVSRKLISKIKSRKLWKHLTSV